MESDDPIARLWVHAMRTELDAAVTRFEAQLKQHVAVTAGARREELAALERQVAAFAARLKESEQRAVDAAARAAERDQEVARMRALQAEAAREIASLQSERDAARAEVERLRSSLRDLGQRVQSLDEQFAAERAFVAALTRVGGTPLFDVAQVALGQPLDPAPACYGAIKARKPDALLAAVVRERGRAVTRNPLSREEREALAALADAAGCALIEVAPGTRFATAVMEKVATRPEPADEDHVLECLMPGRAPRRHPGRRGAPQGVVVATA